MNKEKEKQNENKKEKKKNLEPPLDCSNTKLTPFS